MRVVYADIDPLAVRDTALALDGAKDAAAIEGDAREPWRLLEAASDLLDPGEPVAVIYGAVLQYLTADEARSAVGDFTAALEPRSAVVISVPRFDDPAAAERVAELMAGTGWHNHAPADAESFFAGLRVIRGQVSDVSAWPMLTESGPAARMTGAVGVLD